MNLLTPREAALRMGRPESTIWRWILQGKLPALKVGRCWGITPEDLEAFQAPQMGWPAGKARGKKERVKE